ncbi:hypothetical protein EES43_24490 [Streptomyces sp. ADI96-02]|uniref:DUF6221 family protein n=1 Tax=Streptomyces sp. ADI96-02 TaxID=1522760 RepID=UPI000F54DA0C|nr:DUF6221 family protein [Streptomyces sp. ADI96-02]RPK56204.1 hypothetical protein EES43_24490 [Streptomyces sp. ADI96-02]
MTDALVAFLKARLDDDAQAARKAASREQGGASWRLEGASVRAGDGAPVARHTWADEGAHIARQDPARTLREVEAKRQLIDGALSDRHHVSADQYETCPRATAVDGLDASTAAALEDLNEERRHEDGVEPECWESCGRDARVRRTLELLALPYSDHPGYEEALTGG